MNEATRTNPVGLIPVFVALFGLLFLWGALVLNSLRQYHHRFQEASLARKALFGGSDVPAWVDESALAQIVRMEQEGTAPTGLARAEKAYRDARHLYNKLASGSSSRLFATVFGFGQV